MIWGKKTRKKTLSRFSKSCLGWGISGAGTYLAGGAGGSPGARRTCWPKPFCRGDFLCLSGEIFSPSQAGRGSEGRTSPPAEGIGNCTPWGCSDAQRRHPRSWPCPRQDGGVPHVSVCRPVSPTHLGTVQPWPPPWVAEIGWKPLSADRTLWGWVWCRVMLGRQAEGPRDQHILQPGGLFGVWESRGAG